MATTVIKTVKPSGGDYTSLSAWEAGEQRDLVTLNEIAVAECYSMEDTVYTVINGFTTDATHYIEIRTPLSERHNSKWDNTKYRLNPTGDVQAIRISDNHVRIFGLQLTATRSSGFSRPILSVSSPSNGEFQIAHNIIDAGSQSLVNSCYSSSSDAGTIHKVWNNIMYDLTKSFSSALALNTVAAGSYIYNNTVYGSYDGIECAGTNTTLKNNLVAAGGSGSDYLGTFNPASDYNRSSDATSTGGANDGINQTFTFVDVANRDLHLAAGDMGAHDLGVNLSGTFTDDIDGDIRPATGPWDCGADEIVSAGGTLFISGSTGGMSVVNGSPGISYGASGTLSGLSATSALMGLDFSVTGTIPGVSTLGGTAIRDLSISGALTSTSGTSALAGLIQNLTGAIAALSTTAGTLTLQGVLLISGVANAVTTLTGLAGLTLPLSGATAGTSTASGAAGVIQAVIGAISGVSTATGTLTSGVVKLIAGSIGAVSTLNGAASLNYSLTGASAAVSAMTGTVAGSVVYGWGLTTKSFQLIKADIKAVGLFDSKIRARED